jgi:hypothetical protein
MENKSEYNLTRSQFAEKLGIKRDTLKKQMKRGMHKESYVYHNGKYLFRDQEGMRPNIAYYPGTNVPIKRKRVRRRGNHFDSTYGNLRGGSTHPFKAHNDKKALLRIKKNISDEEAEQFLYEHTQWKEDKRLKEQRTLSNTLRKTQSHTYGTPVYNCKIKSGYSSISWSTKETPLFIEPENEYDKYLKDELGVDLGAPKIKTYY